jgi:hypothetical protein
MKAKLHRCWSRHYMLQRLGIRNGKEDTKTREDRCEAAPARVPALVGVATPSPPGSGGAGDTLSIWSKPGSQNTLATKPPNSGGFTLDRRGVGRQAQTARVSATAATVRSDVARITLRRRQIRGDEIIFSDRRDRIRDMVIFLHCYSGRHVVLLAINMGIARLRRHVGRMKLW